MGWTRVDAWDSYTIPFMAGPSGKVGAAAHKEDGAAVPSRPVSGLVLHIAHGRGGEKFFLLL